MSIHIVEADVENTDNLEYLDFLKQIATLQNSETNNPNKIVIKL